MPAGNPFNSSEGHLPGGNARASWMQLSTRVRPRPAACRGWCGFVGPISSLSFQLRLGIQDFMKFHDGLGVSKLVLVGFHADSMVI